MIRIAIRALELDYYENTLRGGGRDLGLLTYHNCFGWSGYLAIIAYVEDITWYILTYVAFDCIGEVL